ncbi:MAG: FprA family A-type flavoprotein, partial [Thermoprotei archaeon]
YSYLVELYSKWAKAVSDSNKVTIIYSSMYGYVEAMIKKIIDELTKRGYDVHIYKFTDTEHSFISEVLMDVIDSKAIILGTATYETSIFPYMKYIVQLLIDKVNSKKKMLIVTSYGWGGVAGRLLKKMLEQSQFEIIDIIEFNNTYTPEMFEKIVSAINKL